MNAIKKILLTLDGTFHQQTLVTQVATVAAVAGKAEVTLLSVLEAPPPTQETATETGDLQQLMTEERLQQLKKTASELEEQGVHVAVKVTHGKAFMEVIREALKGHYDLVMKPAEGDSTLKRMLFGSTDMQLLRMCPCPVWVIKPTHHARITKVMVAVDLFPFDEEKSELADKLIKWGHYFASLVKAELYIFHGWELYGEATLRGRTVSAYTIDKLVQDEEQRHRRWLDESLAKNGIAPQEVKVRFYKGDSKRLIPEIADEEQIDLLVMGTVGRTGIPGFFIGNTADAVLYQVDCSVLAIKPDRFVTPIKVD